MANLILFSLFGIALFLAMVGFAKVMFAVASSKSARGMGTNKTPKHKAGGTKKKPDYAQYTLGTAVDELGLPQTYDPAVNFGGGMRSRDDYKRLVWLSIVIPTFANNKNLTRS